MDDEKKKELSREVRQKSERYLDIFFNHRSWWTEADEQALTELLKDEHDG